jgi:hypothetical protein
MAALADGLPFTTPGPERKSLSDRPLASALDLGVLLAAFTVTSPHTIHPDANGPSLAQFACSLGVELAEPLAGFLGR